MTKQFPIANGPSKWDLSLALFDTTEDSRPDTIRQNGRIVIIEIEDSNGKKWKGEARISGVEKAREYSFQDNDWILKGDYAFLANKDPFGSKFYVRRPFTAQFNTQTRKGTLEVTKEE